MTAREVHDYYDDWNSNCDTFLNTVSTLLSRFVKSGLIKREKRTIDNIYQYKIINEV